MRTVLTRPLIPLLAACCAAPLGAAELQVAEPEAAAPAEARQSERKRWSWNQPHATITETGRIEWSPENVPFVAGDDPRYIDFESGDDNADGSKAAPWQHHPWDPAATGNAAKASGPRSYVFKRGVDYRGQLVARESGTGSEPIRLTSDPEWGEGEARILGSRAVSGWTKGAQHADIPDAAQVWWVDLDYLPRSLWVEGSGGAERIPLAREPNWTVSDPEDVMSEWWEWEQPEWWTGKNVTKVGTKEMHLAIDTKHLTQPKDYYEGATVRTEYGIVMGTPYPTKVEAVYPDQKALAIEGLWWGTSSKLLTGNRYYLEDKPHYLDQAGEFWFERTGTSSGGRLYLRLPGDADPNAARVEAAALTRLVVDGAAADEPDRLDVLGPEQRAAVSTAGVDHVRFENLSFAYTNTHWDLPFPAWMHRDVDNAAINLRGGGEGIVVAGCTFRDVSQAVRIEGISGEVAADGIAITDNLMERTDHGAISIGGGDIGEVRVLRNKLHLIGLRPFRQSHGHALNINFAQRQEVAGNVLERCYGAGIFVFGGKGGNSAEECPLSRVLIHHNRVEHSLLAANDWGGIETWQGGPFYVYNNISGNPNGYWHWAAKKGNPGGARLGFAYYCDGAFKNYHFNNVAWGLTADRNSKHMNKAAFYTAVPTVENLLFNNTASRFDLGSNWSPRGGRQYFLGNVFSEITNQVFNHGKLKEDPQPVEREHPYHTMAYANNVFHAAGGDEAFGVFQADGSAHGDAASMRAALEQRQALASDLGVVADAPVLRDVEAKDFRLKPGSAAVDAGVTVAVPWSLARTVGEWHFRASPADPTVVTDHHWFMTPDYQDRGGYHNRPMFDLRVAGATADSYGTGPTEDWIASALILDGERHAVLDNATITAPITFETGKKNNKVERTLAGADKASADVHGSNLLIELVLRADAGQGPAVIVAKHDDQAGYRVALNAAGGVTFGTRSGGTWHELAAGAIIADGGWHHLVVELDRAAGRARIHVDGITAAEGAIDLSPDASLSNGGDLLVGAGPDGHGLRGAVDMLRICLATLDESHTSIEELYDWQTDGPHLRDLRGQEVTGERRDAGAFELAE